MKLLIKMLGFGLIVAAAITYDRQRLRRAGRLDANLFGGQGAGRDISGGLGESAGFGGSAGFSESAGFGESAGRGAGRDVEVVTDATIVGISEVDPEPLAGMGEGIDPDAVDEAHRSVREQRERLPVSGKNVP